MIRKILEIWAFLLAFCVIVATLFLVGYLIYAMLRDGLWWLLLLGIFVIGGLFSAFYVENS